MRRRDFIKGIAGAMAWPLAARAQQLAKPIVGFLNTTSPDTYAFNVDAFRDGLHALGYTDGQNVTIEYRWANGDYSRMPALATDLVNHNVAVIAATGDIVSARAAQAATSTIPIVFTIGSDPVRFGLVKSLNQSGTNLTGMTLFSSTLMAKRMEILTRFIPNSRPIALLMNPDNANAETDRRDAEEAAQYLGKKTVVVNARTGRDFSAAFAAMADQHVRAALVASDPILLSERVAMADLAAQYGMPVIHFAREFVVAGGLASYGSGVTWAYYQAGVYCGRILKGARVDDLPVQQPTKFDLVINLKTAKALSIPVPPSLIAIADEVVE
jgi:putative tryptophan/tyrosine transport system substrate-binding protein